MEIASKRHPYKFYLLLILMSFFFLGIGSIFIYASLRDNNNVGYYLFFVFFALTLYMNFLLINNSSKITLNKKGIIYRNRVYDWDEIKEIKLNGKSGLFFNAPAECTTLLFKDSTTIKIFDDLYHNSSEMKCFIQEIVINKKDKIEDKEEKLSLSDFDKEFFIPYKGNPVISFRGIFMWGLILFFIFLPLFSKKPAKGNGYLFINCFSLLWFLLNSWLMNYFEISKNYFVIKNHYFFWKKDIYHISEIKEVVYESQGKQPNTLRIITNKFKSKLYPAGTLTDATWLEMKTELESKNINVRNECI